jgi:hypothetical protein
MDRIRAIHSRRSIGTSTGGINRIRYGNAYIGRGARCRRSPLALAVAENGKPDTLESTNSDTNELSEGTGGLHGSTMNRNSRVATLRAQKSAVVAIEEGEKHISTYMTLPASQYSVLDAKKIERIDDDTFKCYVGGINFMNFRVEPVLTLSVIVGARGPTVKLLETTLEGSKAAMEANKKFTATMVNEVEWREQENGELCICSDTSLQVTLQVPRWFLLPAGVVESSGSKIMQTVLETAVPRFLVQLDRDYRKWCAGEDRSRM